MPRKRISEYECIQAWDRMMGSNWDYTLQQIEQARRDKAPEDAIFYSTSKKEWTTLKDVTSNETRWHFQQNYPWLVARYTDWEQGQQQSSSK